MPELDPITYPKVTLAGNDYEVKFRSGDIIRLKKNHGIDLMGGGMQDLKGVEALERTLQMLQAGIAHVASFNLDELADMVVLQDVPLIAAAVIEALSKVHPQAAKLMQEAAQKAATAAAPSKTLQ